MRRRRPWRWRRFWPIRCAILTRLAGYSSEGHLIYEANPGGPQHHQYIVQRGGTTALLTNATSVFNYLGPFGWPVTHDPPTADDQPAPAAPAPRVEHRRWPPRPHPAG